MAAKKQTPKKSAAKGEKRYYRIGEVSKLTDVKPYVLRYWENEFRWMAPAKSRSKQRLYRHKDIEVIQLIKRLLYEERYTIAGARRKLRELGVDPLGDPLEFVVRRMPDEIHGLDARHDAGGRGLQRLHRRL